MNGEATVTPCLILDDEELNSLKHRIQWRQKGTQSVQALFNTTKGKPEFPKAFQTYKGALTQGVKPTSFPFVPKKKVQALPTPVDPPTPEYAACTPPPSPKVALLLNSSNTDTEMKMNMIDLPTSLSE
jgi:hypothetical protein